MFSGVEKGCIESEWVKTDKFWDVDIDNKLVPFKYAATKKWFSKKLCITLNSGILWEFLDWYELVSVGINLNRWYEDLLL